MIKRTDNQINANSPVFVEYQNKLNPLNIYFYMRFTFTFLGICLALVLSACSLSSFEDDTASNANDPNDRGLQVTDTPIDNLSPISTADSEVVASRSNNQHPEMAFGIESQQMNFQDHIEFIGDSKLQLVRHNGLNWQNVEPIEGNRQWGAVSELESKLANASASGLSTILIVRGAPDWAQQIPGSTCGPIKPDKLENFAAFLKEAVSRYSVPPYEVKYWELGNEPDVDPSLISPNSPFGCWGDQNDPFYGGGYYAEMLKVAYPAIKSADPDAKVLIGGLLLDCDPTHPPEGAVCTPGKFFEGILKNGGEEYFDILSFHGYAPYLGSASGFPYELYYDDHHPNWEHRGGVVLGKVDFLRQVMAEFNVDKPIFHTEGALLCPKYYPADCNPPGESFLDSQADYIVRMFVRNWANGISGTIWYLFEGPGWLYSSLLDENQTPKPAYEALDFLTTRLSTAEYSRELQQFGSLEGYEFTSPESRIWVLWSPEEIDTQIQLPENVFAVFNKYGGDITPESREITVNDPIYLLLSLDE